MNGQANASAKAKEVQPNRTKPTHCTTFAFAPTTRQAGTKINQIDNYEAE